MVLQAVGEIRRLSLLFQRIGWVSPEGAIGQKRGNQTTHFRLRSIDEGAKGERSRRSAPMGGSEHRFQVRDRFGSKSIALEADAVDGPDACTVPLDDHVGGDVLLAERAPGDEGIVADGEPLTDSREATKGNVISNSYMTSELNGVGYSDAATEHAVVGDVTAGHQQGVVADDGVPTFRARMNGHILSYFHAISDIKPTIHFTVLRRMSCLRAPTDDGKWMHNALFAKRRSTHDRVPLDAATGPNPRPRLHNRVRADHHAAPQRGFGRDQSPGIDPAHQAAPPRVDVR